MSKIKLELGPQITQMLDTQDITLDKAILDLYNQYKQEHEQLLNNKERFVTSLHVEVDSKHAIEKLFYDGNQHTPFTEKEIGG